MRTLTKREKVLLAIVGMVSLIAFALRILPAAIQGLAGIDFAEKRDRLQTAENLVRLDQQANRIDKSLRTLVGLQGRLVSDSLFNEIKQLHSVEALNQTRRMSELIALHPALEGKAAALFAYKTRRGGFTNLEELKTIQGSIFEGEQPRVVISQRISQLAKRSGLKPDYQLNIKPSPGKNTEKILHQAKRNFVLYSYMKELEDELEQIAEQKGKQEESPEEQLDREGELERAMFEGWWGDYGSAETGAHDAKDEVVHEGKSAEDDERDPQPDSSSTQVKTAINIPHDGDSFPDDNQSGAEGSANAGHRFGDENLSFIQLPAIIPMELRVQLIEFILSFIRLELNGAATDFKRGFIAAQVSRADETLARRFLEFGARDSAVRVGLKEDSVLLAKFEGLIDQYNATRIDDYAEGTSNTLSYEKQIMALTEYVYRTELRIKELEKWLAGVSLTHQPELYGVEMKFTSGIGTVVKLMESIDVSTKWLYVKSLKLVNDKSAKKEEEERARLSVELSMVARVL